MLITFNSFCSSKLMIINMTFSSVFLVISVLTLWECSASTEYSDYTTKPCKEGESIEIHCPEGQIIDIQWASYKSSAGIGNNNKQCGDPNATAKVENHCDGMQTCEITCNDGFFDETTCDKKKEKMRVNYDCIQDPCQTFCCANQGTCTIDANLEPTCECFGSWTGEHCDESPCIGHICDDDSVCTVDTDTGLAQCYKEEQVNPCDGVSCGENASCWVDPETMTSGQCFCNEGSFGPSCVPNPCDGINCGEGASCWVDPETMSTGRCFCTEGWDCPSCVPIGTCPSGWIENGDKCILFSMATVSSWYEAKTKCEEQGATLWKLPPEDVMILVNFGDITKQYWLGVTDIKTEGNFVPIGSDTTWTLASSISMLAICISMIGNNHLLLICS